MNDDKKDEPAEKAQDEPGETAGPAFEPPIVITPPRRDVFGRPVDEERRRKLYEQMFPPRRRRPGG